MFHGVNGKVASRREQLAISGHEGLTVGIALRRKPLAKLTPCLKPTEPVEHPKKNLGALISGHGRKVIAQTFDNQAVERRHRSPAPAAIHRLRAQLVNKIKRRFLACPAGV
jgi:antitoxin (DNA-binding transcriptional repressor) of toxin-antitoxin stability system